MNVDLISKGISILLDMLYELNILYFTCGEPGNAGMARGWVPSLCLT